MRADRARVQPPQLGCNVNLPNWKYLDRANAVKVHSVDLDGNDELRIYTEGNGAYEWLLVIDGNAGTWSDVGYGSIGPALRDGLLDYYGAGVA